MHIKTNFKKKRIIEYLDVQKPKIDAKNIVLCFLGPLGIGKTSLASSIDMAVDKTIVPIYLGGVNNEADIRGLAEDGHEQSYNTFG